MPTNALPWTPPNRGDVKALPTGLWWDAVRAAPAIGDRALDLLGDATGAVIQDTYGTLYWLTKVGTARSWHLRKVHALTQLVDEATYLGVPPASRTKPPGTHWRIPLGHDRYLTHADRLHAALAQAVLDERPVRRTPRGRPAARHRHDRPRGDADHLRGVGLCTRLHTDRAHCPGRAD
jgi:hypothetical protein